MSEQNLGGGTADVNAGGEDVVKQSVAYDSHKKALDQLKASKRELEAINAKLAEYEAQKQADEAKRLEEEKKYKELADSYKVKYEAEANGRTSLEKAIINAEKVEAFEQAIGAKLAHPSFKNHIDLESIKMVDGEIDTDSLNQVIKSFSDTFGNSLLKQSTIKAPPADAPKGQPEKTLADMTTEERAAIRRQLLKK